MKAVNDSGIRVLAAQSATSRRQLTLWVAVLVCTAALWMTAAAWAGGASVSLIEAVKADNRAQALQLIQQGADVNAREPDGTTALHYAAHNGNAELVERLLRAKAKVNVQNDYGASPMSEAAQIGHAGIIKALLKAGADVESPNREGQTALMAVARAGNVEAAQALLKAGAQVDAREQWGQQTALMWAAAQRQAEMVKLLIQHRADVNARAAVRDWQRRSTAEPRPKGMNRGGLTPLLFAAREGCVQCAKYLIEEGKADINLPDPDRTSPLLLALMNLHFDLAAYLITAGADVDQWDFYGQTPLYVAIDMNTLPKGGRPDLPSEDRTTALEVAEMLLQRGANPDIQLKLRPPYRNYIFDRGGDQVLSTGATPLLRAAKAGDVAAMELLVKYRANIELATSTGVTPLMVAAGMGHGDNPTRGRYKTDADAAAAFALLKEAGAKVNAKAANGQTALHAAAAKGWDRTVVALAEGGAELEAVDNNGLRPIDYAAGRQPRQFLETEKQPNESTIALLTKYIVAHTGRQPQQFSGTLANEQRGTGGAP